MELDELAQDVGGGAIELQATRGTDGELSADQFVGPPGNRLAGIVEQQGEVQNLGALHLLEQWRVIFVGASVAPATRSSLDRATSVCSSTAYWW